MDPFARQARQYVLSRPNYPQSFISRIFSQYPNRPASKTCLDVGCGSGQLTLQLAEHFGKVVGVDRSAAQLENALKHENISYMKIDDAIDLHLFKDNSFDCVTVAQTLHWLPMEKALNEFHRVLKPGGCLFALGYGVCNVDNESAFCKYTFLFNARELTNKLEAQQAFEHYYLDVLGTRFPFGHPQCLWDCDRRRLDTGHASETFSPPFVSLERWTLDDSRTVTNAEFLDYLKTWSAYQKLIKSGKSQTDPLGEIARNLGEPSKQVVVTFPFWIVKAMKPRT